LHRKTRLGANNYKGAQKYTQTHKTDIPRREKWRNRSTRFI